MSLFRTHSTLLHVDDTSDLCDRDMDLLRYEGCPSTYVLPHRLASNNERFYNGLIIFTDSDNSNKNER